MKQDVSASPPDLSGFVDNSRCDTETQLLLHLDEPTLEVESENSAGGPSGKEGGSFIVDFVLEEFILGVLPFTSSPPTDLHLKNKEQNHLYNINVYIEINVKKLE